MKKLFTLLTMLIVGIGSMWGQVVTDRASAGNPLTFNGFKAFAGTGKHFAIVSPSTSTVTYNKWFSFATGGYPEMLTTAQLFDLENSVTGNDWYYIKRVSDGKYVSTEGGNFDASTKMDFKLVNRRAGDYADEFSNADLHVSLDNAAGNHYNANPTNLGFRGGTGGYSAYITYGPFYVVTVNCKNNGTTFQTLTYIAKDNTEITAPNNINPYISSDASQTVNSADATFDFNYTFDHSNTKCYNIRNNRGTWAVASGANVVNSTAELNLAFSASDVKQQFALIYYDATDDETDNGNYYLYSVGESKFAYVDGEQLSLTTDFTAQVEASPVTFGASTSSTYKNSAPLLVKIGGKTFGVHTSHSPDVYDYSNHDGDDGNASAIYEAGGFDATAAKALIDFYYNHTITYIVKDESNNALFTSGPVNIYKGTHNTLPDAYQRPYFYTYTTEGVTINDESSTNTDLIFTAAPKSNILQYTANSSSPIYYNLNIRSKYLAYNDEATGDVELLDTSTPFNPDAAWAFIGDPYTGFKIINQTNGTDKYLTYTNVVAGNNHGNNNIQFVNEENFTDQYWYFETNSSGYVLRMKSNMSIYFHHDISSNFLRTCSKTEWSAVHNDEGSTIVFASDEDVLQSLYDNLKDVYFADGVGKYQWNGSGTAEEARANINGAGMALAVHATSNYKELYDALTDIKNNITINLPTTGFYRLKGYATNKYAKAGTITVSNVNDNTDPTSYIPNSENIETNGSDIWYYDADKHLINYYNGLGTYATRAFASLSKTKETATFAESTCKASGAQKMGVYEIKSNYSGTSKYWYSNTDNVDRNTNNDNVNCEWEVSEVTSLPVTFKTAGLGYSTLYTPVALQLPDENTHAYVCQRNDNTLTFYEITAITTKGTNEDDVITIPANTAVMLYNSTVKDSENETETFNFPITTCNSEITNNSFEGTLAAVTLNTLKEIVEEVPTYDVYSLRTKSNQVGFFQKTSGDCAGFKAWLRTDHTDGARNFTIYFDGEGDPTGLVEALGLQNDNIEIYDLNGRKLSSYKKGINIINGKKVMVK